MLTRWLAGAIALAAFALVAMPTAGQAPAPPCPAGAQVPPDRFEFTEDPDTSPTQSVAATHPVALFIGVDSGSLTSVTDPAIQIAGPPGLAVAREPQYDDTTHLKVDFTPAAPGPLSFTATWTQLTQAGGPPCTAAASATVAVTAPTLARASRRLGYTIGHRPGKAGNNNEFTLSARVISDPRHGDRSPMAVELMAGSHTRFVLVNRAINPLVRGLLRSPAHGLVSSHLALLTVTGRRSGRTFTFPVGYRREGDRVTIGVGWPERKRWWRNLLDAAPVEIWLAGVRWAGTGQAHGDEHTGVTVEIQLNAVAGPPRRPAPP